MQAAGEAALAERGLPGAFVSMNIHTGEILGMGSNPTYDPTRLDQTDATRRSTKHSPRKKTASRSSTGRPNRPTRPGSTYKIITALAALENGVITGNTVIDDNGYIELGGQKFENSEGEINGPISLVHALKSPPTSSSTNSARK